MKRIFDRDTWQEIFGSIQKNKVRTIITMIGVLWGIFIYIALSGSSKGLDNGFERAFQSIASNSIFVWAQSTSIPYGGYKSERRIQLKLGDVEILKKRVKGIKFIAPRNVAGVFGSAGGNIVRGTKTGTYAIYGEFPEYIKIATAKIFDGGRFINESDIKNERKVCVIGERTQLELFEENENPIGQFISINKINFRVVGVHKFVQGGGFGDDGDIYIPFATFRKIFNTGDNVGWFMIAADENIDGLGIDWRHDLNNALNILGKDYYVQGNLDPSHLFLPWNILRTKWDELFSSIENNVNISKSILGLGHGVLQFTPQENVKNSIQHVHDNFLY